MGQVVVIRPGQKNDLLDRLYSGKLDRVEVCLEERTCRVYLEGDDPVSPEVEAGLGRRLSQALGVDFQVTVSVKAAIRRYLAVDPGDEAEKTRLREAQEAEEAARVKDLLAQAGQPKRPRRMPVPGPGEWELLRGRSFSDQAREIVTVTEEEKRLALEGEVVTSEVRLFKTGRRLLSFDLTDLTDSLSAKCFLEKDEPDPSGSLAPGTWVKVRGPVQFDRYANELCLIAEDILIGSREEREDLSEEKRVELHLHTKMSSMDGCLDPSEAVKRAACWGHPAVAITDHGVLQAYPEAFEAGRKHKIKVIFGLEAYLVDDPAPVVTRPRSQSLAEIDLVALDLETTGLSPAHDEIIEIGAVKYRDGQAVDEFCAFIAPGRPISAKVQELTGITPDMLRGAEPPDQVLRRFWEWAGPKAVLLAHNASFDYSFLRFWSERLLGLTPDHPVIDTLWMARAILARLKSHSLSSVTSELKLKLENHHRALSDAKTAALVYYSLLTRARGDGTGDNGRRIETLEDLNRLTADISPEAVRPTHATILVRTQAGIKNLYRLVSLSHLNHFYRYPRIPRRLLQEHREGLLVGSACEAGEVFSALLKGAPEEEIRERSKFYDFLEIMPEGNNRFLVDQGVLPSLEALREINRRIYQLGREIGCPVVATGDVHYLDERHEIYRRILKTSQGFADDGQAGLHFRTTGEMLDEFSYLGDEASREVVVTNPRAIAGSVEDVRPVPEGLYTPEMPGAGEEIRRMTIERARELYGDPLPDLVERRLQKELQAITGNGFAVIYLIAHKLVKKSLDDGYLVGSRGSVGSSLVATMCQITEVNPLPPHYRCPECRFSYFLTDGSAGSGFDLPDRHCPDCGAKMGKDGQDIPFETFLGFDGDKVPDIDLNFSGEYQSTVHKYCEELFGSEYVYRAGTIATIAERTAYGFVKSFLEKEGRTNPRKAEINRLALGLTGVKRTTGQHPGGMIIVPQGREVYDFTPVQFPADDRTSSTRTTHFDFHSIHDNLLKLDILGHDDPTALRMLQDLTGIDVKTIPFDDPATQSLFYSTRALALAEGETVGEVGTIGVPEFGTGFVRRMLVETRPNTFSDLVRISGLSHGTDVWTNNAQELIKNRVATLSEVIPCRDDIMVYLMYRGLEPRVAFKIMEKVRKGKGLATEDEDAMRGQGVPDWYIQSCKKIKYMFPKAHAAAYVMMGFRIAWFKVHYPLAFYATYFSVRAGEFDAVVICAGPGQVRRQAEELEKKGNSATAKEKNLLTILEVAQEMYARGFRFHKVDLYKSHTTNFLIEDGALRPPLKSLPTMGVTAAANIASARSEAAFTSLEELRVRARLNKTVIDLLVSHGAVPDLPGRSQLALL